MMATMLAGIAEFERDLLRKRVRSGLAAARARGKVLGRQLGQRPKSDRLAPKVLALVDAGRSYRLIGRELGLSKNTVADIVKRRRVPDAGSSVHEPAPADSCGRSPSKSQFPEEARGIVAKDRYDRKYGHAVDTAGAIARALERAYKQGFADAQDDHVRPTPEVSDGGPLEWVLIRPVPETRSGPAACSCLAAMGPASRRIPGA